MTGKALAMIDQDLQLTDGDPVFWLALENHTKNLIQLIRQWQDGLQKVTVLLESPVSGIFCGRLFPGVATTGEVDQNYTERPDVIGGASVPRFTRRLI